MSNTLLNQYKTLKNYLDANQLFKVAADQDIEHTTTDAQDNRGAEMQQEIKENVDGVLASTASAENKPIEQVDTPPNCQNLNKEPEAALAATGTSVNSIDGAGDSAPMPAKTASVYRTQLAGILKQMDKKASAKKQAAEDFRTGTEVLQKFASLTANPTEQDLAEAQDELLKLANTNPMFHVCRDRILMRKMAEDVEALAEAEGISPEDAANVMDAAVEEDPSIAEDLNDEATGEAVAELADAESATDAMMGDIQQMADGASQVLGEEVTAEDMLNAIDEVEAQAEAMGVPPEALIQEALSEIAGDDMSVEGGEEEEITPEDEAEAEQLLEEAAQNGISPEEVLQMAAEMAGEEGGEGASAEASAEAPAEAPASDDAEGSENGEGAAEPETKKEASLAKTARARYVQHLARR